jgi:hypothetical protein
MENEPSVSMQSVNSTVSTAARSSAERTVTVDPSPWRSAQEYVPVKERKYTTMRANYV